MAQDIKKEELTFDGSIKQNKKGQAILGVLEGPCADIINPTRNGRFYSEELWEKVFNSDIAKETFNAGGFLGELDHPTDRSETCTEKVCVCMAEPPKKNEKGQLIGKWDILDTPNGRILKTLCDYGYKMGISSRGTGDVTEDYNGNESVDPDSYDFQGFDIVLLPAVKAARLHLVNESLGNKTFKQALKEALESTDDVGKKVMLDTLNHLDINIDNKTEMSEDKKEEEVEKVDSEKDTANDDGVELIKNLQESLKREQLQKEQLKDLQEKLSVCYAKEAKYEEQLQRYKSSIIKLSENVKVVKALSSQVDSLQEKLKTKEQTINDNKIEMVKLSESRSKLLGNQKSLNESLSDKDLKIKSLTESLNKQKSESEKAINSLQENIETMKKNSAIKNNEYSTKISEMQKLNEKYKTIAKVAVDKYISEKALLLGVTPEEIKCKLTENYSFNDIDKVCEGLKSYKLNISRLPIEVKKSINNSKVQITESKESIMPKSRFDDSIDDSLMNLANKF